MTVLDVVVVLVGGGGGSVEVGDSAVLLPLLPLLPLFHDSSYAYVRVDHVDARTKWSAGV